MNPSMGASPKLRGATSGFSLNTPPPAGHIDQPIRMSAYQRLAGVVNTPQAATVRVPHSDSDIEDAGTTSGRSDCPTDSKGGWSDDYEASGRTTLFTAPESTEHSTDIDE